MEPKKCFDLLAPMVEDFSNRFEPFYKLDTEKYDILHQYCDVIDVLSDELDADFINVTINDYDKMIVIQIGCNYMDIETHKHNFYTLAKRAVSLEFYLNQDENLVIKYQFPTIWNRFNPWKQ